MSQRFSCYERDLVGHRPRVLALIFTLPALLLTLVAVLTLTASLEKSLAHRSMAPRYARVPGVRRPISRG